MLTLCPNDRAGKLRLERGKNFPTRGWHMLLTAASSFLGPGLPASGLLPWGPTPTGGNPEFMCGVGQACGVGSLGSGDMSAAVL